MREFEALRVSEEGSSRGGEMMRWVDVDSEGRFEDAQLEPSGESCIRNAQLRGTAHERFRSLSLPFFCLQLP